MTPPAFPPKASAAALRLHCATRALSKLRSAARWRGFPAIGNSQDLQILEPGGKDRFMQIALPDELIHDLDLTPEHARMDMAIGLYAERRITLGRAAKMAGFLQADFLRKLGELRIPMHYDLPELEEDLLVVREAE
jgi:predicted HTH domain antitoxin